MTIDSSAFRNAVKFSGENCRIVLRAIFITVLFRIRNAAKNVRSRLVWAGDKIDSNFPREDRRRLLLAFSIAVGIENALLQLDKAGELIKSLNMFIIKLNIYSSLLSLIPAAIGFLFIKLTDRPGNRWNSAQARLQIWRVVGVSPFLINACLLVESITRRVFQTVVEVPVPSGFPYLLGDRIPTPGATSGAWVIACGTAWFCWFAYSVLVMWKNVRDANREAALRLKAEEHVVKITDSKGAPSSQFRADNVLDMLVNGELITHYYEDIRLLYDECAVKLGIKWKGLPQLLVSGINYDVKEGAYYLYSHRYGSCIVLSNSIERAAHDIYKFTYKKYVKSYPNHTREAILKLICRDTLKVLILHELAHHKRRFICNWLPVRFDTLMAIMKATSPLSYSLFYRFKVLKALSNAEEVACDDDAARTSRVAGEHYESIFSSFRRQWHEYDREDTERLKRFFPSIFRTAGIQKTFINESKERISRFGTGIHLQTISASTHVPAYIITTCVFMFGTVSFFRGVPVLDIGKGGIDIPWMSSNEADELLAGSAHLIPPSHSSFVPSINANVDYAFREPDPVPDPDDGHGDDGQGIRQQNLSYQRPRAISGEPDGFGSEGLGHMPASSPPEHWDTVSGPSSDVALPSELSRPKHLYVSKVLFSLPFDSFHFKLPEAKIKAVHKTRQLKPYEIARIAERRSLNAFHRDQFDRQLNEHLQNLVNGTHHPLQNINDHAPAQHVIHRLNAHNVNTVGYNHVHGYGIHAASNHLLSGSHAASGHR